ncbi:arsenical pump-driving ATPase [Longimonas halophila]|uniref:arsenite-transporting ATPase n=1 Tax=Longimonas halophila TaxID=1469170 RepID=A0A2H3NIP9_9BACT|nr:arsenical pump-driving ATPase [Longimonas halophila]PEN05238.1 arsenical pump-driving ATPase [Longimonas halophila]
MLSYLNSPTRHLFFTGKGGVGKTSLACASAVKLADAGHNVLLISTDPASNLEQVLEAPVGPEVASVDTVPHLSAINIDPEQAADAYRERVVEPMMGVLPEDTVAQVEEQLSGACTTEIAAFDKFTQFLADSEATAPYDHIVFDTAPTGHTLRLLELPAAWSDFIEDNPEGASCLGPVSGLEAQQDRYTEAVEALNDSDRTTLVLVARPERSALHEAARSSGELRDLGITNQQLVVNGVFQAQDPGDPLAAAMQQRADDAVAQIPDEIADLPRDVVPLKGHNLVGLHALRTLLDDDATPASTTEGPERAPSVSLPTVQDLVSGFADDGHGLIMTMGKGGVGKTTIAAAVAVELAERGEDVLLTTTDPAAHIHDTIGDSQPNLTVEAIDPNEATEQYRERVLKTKGKNLDPEERELLEEDLRSPCTQEVAVFRAFSRVVGQARRQFVVVDTAPTGHTLLLLDTTGSYHREVLRTADVDEQRITTPLMRLQDPDYTKMLLVTLPETTPVLEAKQLQDDLERAGITPYAWVVNQSLAAAGPTDPLLVERAHAEMPQIETVQNDYASRTALAPWMPNEPTGPDRLRDLAAGRMGVGRAHA